MKINIFGSKGLIEKLFGQPIGTTPDELYNKAEEMFKEGNIDDGYVYLQAAAIKGHAEAAFQMGTAISEKKTIAGSMADAVKYYTIASQHDHAFATNNLAMCYQQGTGVEVDHIKAIHLLNKAIKLGDEMASYNLAQAYLFGIGVAKNEKLGWNRLLYLADKGHKLARDYVEELLKDGYQPPIDDAQQQLENSSKNIEEKIYFKDYEPECEILDPKILELYNSVKNGDDSAREELMELAGNQMNREAMNALRKLGLIKQDIDDNFKKGTISYIADAWKTSSVEPLYVICAWTYPGFIYRTYELDKLKYETQSEDVFIECIVKEMSECRKNNIVPKFRIRQVENSSGYCVDVVLPGVSISSFYLDIKDDHFLGLYRVYDDTITDK